VGVTAPNAQKLSEDSAFAKKLIGSKANDIIDFGSGFKVLEVKKYQSK
jgi:transcription elongation GreA/GreB family factor